MKNFFLTLLLILAAGAVSCGTFYLVNEETQGWRESARERNSMAWLRSEFHLDKAQYAAIRDLYVQFLQERAGNTAAISAARVRRDSPGEVAGLEAACVRAMTSHFQKVALLMSPEEGQRYLDMVLPHVTDYDRRGQPVSN